MTPQAASSLPVVVRSTVPTRTNYADYREELRLDFWFACAYCNVSEIEATAMSFEIDHYEPIKWSPELANTYDNLMWSCRLCNRHKGDDRPNSAQRAAGIRFYRPDLDDPEDHFKVVDIEFLSDESDIGKHTISLLFLNRQQLRDLRRARESIYHSSRAIIRGIQALRGLKIDQFPEGIRLRVIELKKTLESEVKKAIEDIEQVLQNFNRARSIDPDPNASQLRKRRQQHMKSLHALFPD